MPVKGCGPGTGDIMTRNANSAERAVVPKCVKMLLAHAADRFYG
jgi:hypothetical protein